MSDDALAQLSGWLQQLPPQRLIVRGVDEVRPLHHQGTTVVVGRATYVEVVRVVDRQRVARRFEGVRLAEATAAAAAAGHDVVRRSGNLS